MIRLESSGGDCPMGMSFREKGVNPSYTHSQALNVFAMGNDEVYDACIAVLIEGGERDRW